MKDRQTGHLLLICLFTITSLAHSGNWENTLHVSMIYSDNVFESIDHTRGDGAARLRIHLKSPVYRTHPKLHFITDLQGGYEGYHQHPVENRWVHHITAVMGWQPLKRLTLNVQFRHKTRYFFDIAHGYHEASLLPGITFHAGMGWSFGWKYIYSDRNFKNGTLFDSRYAGNKFKSKWRISRHFALSGFYTNAAQNFERKSLTFSDTLSFTEGEENQQDRIEQIGFQIELYFNALIRLGFIHEQNRSNSHGFNYSKPQVYMMSAKTFPRGWTISFLLKLAWKDYKDEIAPFWPVSPDTEIEENNSIWTMLSKDINSALTLKIQTGWHRNESPLRNRYYAKHFFMTGISYTL